MEEKQIQEFLNKTGLKAKEIADRVNLGDRAIFKYMKTGKIPPYICKLIELEFSEYDLETGKKIPGLTRSKETPSKIIQEKDTEIERLKNIIIQKDRTIENLNEMIDLVKNKPTPNAG